MTGHVTGAPPLSCHDRIKVGKLWAATVAARLVVNHRCRTSDNHRDDPLVTGTVVRDGRMRSRGRAWRLTVAACVICQAAPAAAGDLGRMFQGLAAPFRAARREPPPPSHGGDPLQRLGDQAEWLEHHLDLHGSIVAKEPDVWGQSRLMRHRVEYEEQMRRQLGLFSERTSAALRRSDQAFLGMALALESAAANRRPSVAIDRPEPPGPPRTPPDDRFDDEPLALEPTRHLDQLSRYLTHLSQLRRVNEGDDSADSPGYALNLIRIPVSVLPGRRTREGHGAEITFTAEPCLGADLLPTTFRALVINDLVDLVAPALTWCVNDADCLAWAATIARGTTTGGRQGVMDAMEALAARLPTLAPTAPPTVKTRRARMPIPFSQLADVSGIGPIAVLIRDTRAALEHDPANQPCIGYPAVRSLLVEELGAAADLLALPEHRELWAELAGWNLPVLVRGRRHGELETIRCRVFAGLGSESAFGDGHPLPVTAVDACCDEPRPARPLCRTTTAALAWGILVESALLDARLVSDIRESATARGRVVAEAGCTGPFFGPDPAPEARAAFADYVRTRWPIRVFALDPVREEQNVDDSFSRRRELQVAMALAAAGGRLNAQAYARYTRRLETDMAAVKVHPTAVGFAHGADTFGWRFYPRVQTPPVRGTFATLAETVCGGPTTDADRKRERLEPGQRECTALVVMPAFVPTVSLAVSTRWFPLAHAATSDPTLRQTLEMSRAVQAIRQDQAACSACAHRYRPGEIAHVLARVEQLERRLPLQSLQARIPFEDTVGGFELFDAGVTALAPELTGWYGAAGVDPDATTTLFLVGKGFSVHDTSVIAGGRPVRATPMSRELIRVEIPPGARPVPRPGCRPAAFAGSGAAGPRHAVAVEALPPPTFGPAAAPEPAEPAMSTCDCNGRDVVDVHLATPYGVSSRLLIPVVRPAAATAATGPTFADPCTVGLSFTAARTAGSRAEAARIDEFFSSSCDAISIAVPASWIPPPKASLRLLLRDAASGATAASLSVDGLVFDARRSRYVIAGAELRNFVGDTSRPATDKTLRGGIKPYLDEQLARGGLADDGDTLALTLTASIVAEQQEVPVAGAIRVEVTRRGKMVTEPRPEPARVPEALAP